MPDIISSKEIRPASESRLVFQCISFVLRNPYQDYQDRLLLIHAEFNSGNPCCAKQSYLGLSHVFDPWGFSPFGLPVLSSFRFDGSLLPPVVSGEFCSWLLLVPAFCTPCWLFGSLGAVPSFLFPKLPLSACGHLAFRLCVSCSSPSPFSFPRSSRLTTMLERLVCAAACDLLPFPTSSRPLPSCSSSLRVPMVMPYSRFSSLPIPFLCVRLPSSSFVCLVSSRSS